MYVCYPHWLILPYYKQHNKVNFVITYSRNTWGLSVFSWAYGYVLVTTTHWQFLPSIYILIMSQKSNLRVR